MEGGARDRPGGPASPRVPPGAGDPSSSPQGPKFESLPPASAWVRVPPPPVPLPVSRTWRRPCLSSPHLLRRPPPVPVPPTPPLTASCSRGAPSAIGGSTHCSTARRPCQLGSAPPPAAAGAGHGGACVDLAGEALGASPQLRGPLCGSSGVRSAARPEQAPLRHCWGCLGLGQEVSVLEVPLESPSGCWEWPLLTCPLRPQTTLDRPSPQRIMS